MSNIGRESTDRTGPEEEGQDHRHQRDQRDEDGDEQRGTALVLSDLVVQVRT